MSFVDSDDAVAPWFLSRQMALLAGAPADTAATLAFRQFTDPVPEVPLPENPLRGEVRGDALLRALWGLRPPEAEGCGDTAFTANWKLFPRAVFDRLRFADVSVVGSEDEDFFFRAISCGAISAVRWENVPGLFYRVRPGQTTAGSGWLAMLCRHTLRWTPFFLRERPQLASDALSWLVNCFWQWKLGFSKLPAPERGLYLQALRRCVEAAGDVKLSARTRRHLTFLLHPTLLRLRLLVRPDRRPPRRGASEEKSACRTSAS